MTSWFKKFAHYLRDEIESSDSGIELQINLSYGAMLSMFVGLAFLAIAATFAEQVFALITMSAAVILLIIGLACFSFALFISAWRFVQNARYARIR